MNSGKGLIGVDQLLDQCGIKIGSNFHNHCVVEANNPAVPVVESHSTLGEGIGTQLHDRPITIGEHILDMKLSALLENFVQPRKGMGVKLVP